MGDVRQAFHETLDEVQADIVRLAAMATETIPRVTAALLDLDLDAAQQVIDDDDEIDALTHEIEERIYELMMLQAPVASDLRRLVTALWMTGEIERSADLATNIAKGARRIYGIELHPVPRGLIAQMADESARLFRLAIDAYVHGEAGLAAALDDMDDRLDLLHNEYIQSLFEHQTEHGVQPAVQLALIGRYYERIGDHAVNMGERVGYMVTGELAGAETPSAPAPAAPKAPLRAVDGPDVDAGSNGSHPGAS